MSNSILTFANKGLEDLHPYEPGRPIEDVVAEYGPKKVVKLASNENPLGASPKAKEVLNLLSNDLHLYPDGDAKELKDSIGELEKVPSSQIIIGNGSNEIIEIAARAFLNNNTSALMSKHAFAVYKIISQSCGSKVIEVPMLNWSHDLGSFKDYLSENTRIIFVANPNNPTGTFNSQDEFKSMMQEIPSSVLVVLDLAYFEYVESDDYINVQELLNEYNNILITKTFSKIHGIASLRVGYGLCSEELCSVLNKVRQPFNVNFIAQKAAIAAIHDEDHIQKSKKLNSSERQRVNFALKSIGMDCIDSQGNFITFKGAFDAQDIFIRLMKRGVIVRPMALYDMPEYIRMTIGTKEENDYFLDNIGELL